MGERARGTAAAAIRQIRGDAGLAPVCGIEVAVRDGGSTAEVRATQAALAYLSGGAVPGALTGHRDAGLGPGAAHLAYRTEVSARAGIHRSLDTAATRAQL